MPMETSTGSAPEVGLTLLQVVRSTSNKDHSTRLGETYRLIIITWGDRPEVYRKWGGICFKSQKVLILRLRASKCIESSPVLCSTVTGSEPEVV